MPQLVEHYSAWTQSFIPHRRAAQRAIAAQTGVRNPTYTAGPAHGVNTATYPAFMGGCHIPGTTKILFAPDVAAGPGIFDAATDAFFIGSPHGGVSFNSFSGATAVRDNLIVYAPRRAANWVHYNPLTDTHEQGGAHGFSGDGSATWGAYYVGDDANGDPLVIGFPSTYGRFLRYNPRTRETTPSAQSVTAYRYNGGVILPNRDILLFASPDSVTALLYRVRTDVIESIPLNVSARGGVLSPDGLRAYMVPSAASRVFSVPTSPVVNRMQSSDQFDPTGSLKFAGGALMPDGCVLFAPDNYGTFSYLTPEGALVNGPSVGAATGKFAGIVTDHRGRAIAAPAFHPNVGIVNWLDGGEPLPGAVVQSMFWGNAL